MIVAGFPHRQQERRAREMAQEYPKEVKVKDGGTVVLRPFERKDKDALFAFFAKLPESDRLFLKDNVSDPAVVERWATELNYEKVFPILAWKGNDVIADATLHKNLGGWMKHVGTIRIVIAPEFQRKGLGSVLANELFLNALKSGLEKIVAEMMETQQGAKKVFEKLGFKQEAIFHGHVRDQIGVRHDLLILTKDLEEFWANIQTHEYFSYPSREMEG
jgi:RimJ/RimL family protein N-acetyltransferase